VRLVGYLKRKKKMHYFSTVFW